MRLCQIRSIAIVAPAQRKRYHTLDAFRGVAALFVASYHFTSREGGATQAYLAVDLFFVLSGFVIALNYSKRLGSGLSCRTFTQLRLLRLFPMYILGALAGLLKEVAAIALNDPRSLAFPTLFCSTLFAGAMLPSPCTSLLFPLNSPSWSLFFEISVNLVFAAWSWRASTRTLIIIVSASLFGLALAIQAPLYFNVGWSWQTSYVGALRAAFSFTVGVLIYRHFNLKGVVSCVALGLVLVMSVGLCVTLPANIFSFEQFAIVVVGFPILVMLGIRFEAPRMVVPLFSFLGDLSYPVYAIHYPLIPLFILVFRRLGLSPATQLFTWLVVIGAIGYAAARADLCFRQKMTGWLRSRRTGTPQPA